MVNFLYKYSWYGLDCGTSKDSELQRTHSSNQRLQSEERSVKCLLLIGGTLIKEMLSASMVKQRDKNSLADKWCQLPFHQEENRCNLDIAYAQIR
ncbi:hypothetical protein NC651_010581 [Populus alba x Populus x berolinensis]|nr:hypothetical protein NC651_010581 [Populus alba x Populus x berolinensis]